MTIRLWHFTRKGPKPNPADWHFCSVSCDPLSGEFTWRGFDYLQRVIVLEPVLGMNGFGDVEHNPREITMYVLGLESSLDHQRLALPF